MLHNFPHNKIQLNYHDLLLSSPFSLDITPRQWVIGTRRFGINTLSQKVGHQNPYDGALYPEIMGTTTAHHCDILKTPIICFLTKKCYRWSLVRNHVRDIFGGQIDKFTFGRSDYQFRTYLNSTSPVNHRWMMPASRPFLTSTLLITLSNWVDCNLQYTIKKI